MKTVIGIIMAFNIVAFSTAFAEDMTGVTATEIKIGNTAPYSGPAAPNWYPDPGDGCILRYREPYRRNRVSQNHLHQPR